MSKRIYAFYLPIGMMNGKGMCPLHKAAGVLVIVGALNWGLVGVAKFNLVMALLGAWPMVERIVYVVIGLAALAMLTACKCCMKGCKCGDQKCGHCGMDEKKSAMGGQQM